MEKTSNKISKRNTSMNDILFYTGMAGLGIILTTLGFYKYKQKYKSNQEDNILDSLSEINMENNIPTDYISMEKIKIIDIINKDKDKNINEGKQEMDYEENIHNLLEKN